MIVLDRITKIYGKSFVAVDKLNLTVEKGSIAAFVGENGAGKTTAIKMMTGVLKPDSGNIRINGFDIVKEPLSAKRSIAYVADNPDMFLRLSGLEFLNLMADIYGVPKALREERIKKTGERFGMLDALSGPMNEYSHGMRQKVMIMAALIHEPPVWILDEPMTGLDPGAAYELKSMMKEHAAKGNAVFFSTHVLEVAEELCDIIFIIRRGRLIFNGTLAQLKEEHPGKTLEEIFVGMSAV